MLARLLLAAGLLAVSVTACGGGGSKPADEPAPLSYLAHKGTVTPLRQAMNGIAFRPFMPSRRIVEAALLPAYNNVDDTRQNRGIGMEYVSSHESYVLSQWPGAGKAGPIALPPERGCSLSAYHLGDRQKQQGVLWSKGGTVLNLVPSGAAPPRATIAEARRLVRMGACR